MIDDKVLNFIYEKIKTPKKLGIVIKHKGYLCDSPVVFKHNNKFYMTYVIIDENCLTGYKTKLATSDDLLTWTDLGFILTDNNGWDSKQTGGYAQFIDNNFGGDNEILKINGKYIFAFIGGNKCGYESDPLSMGIAFCDEIEDFSTYRKAKNPVLSGCDNDARNEEKLTIYKADMFVDEKKTLGHKYVCAYNAKNQTNRESIFLAVSDDGEHWKRHLDKPIINVFDSDESYRINGDPQIVKIDGYYVMFYFIYAAGEAYNTFAVSEDLINWVKWKGEPVMKKSSDDWENVFAHKQWIIKKDGIVYQYYCAVNDAGERAIALAVSE